MQTDFEIKILRQHWISDDGKYDPADHCSHGEVFVRIGEEVISERESGLWTLSAMGLYLLRSLDSKYVHDAENNPFVPCCGFSLYPDEVNPRKVHIIGCPNGYNWNIRYEDDSVLFESEKGSKGRLSMESYKSLVRNLVSEIEGFYGNPAHKTLPEDAYDRKGFLQFWAEWRYLKEKWLV